MPPSTEEALFALALAKPVGERAAFLDAICGSNTALCQRLEALLAAHEATDDALASQNDAARPSILMKSADERSDEAVGQTLGRYKLLERLGEGGCGVVYVADQIQPVRRRVALKVIKLGMDTKQVIARFEAERQALAMMDHPNIAKVLDAGSTEAGRPYFVMELVRGVPITHYCDNNELSTAARLDLFIKVCQAIQHAHQKGIIHRDIKPSNILVTVNDGVPVPKVIDFGIAKATEGRLTDNTVYTQLHQFIGTPAYMSPEQTELTSLDIDTRSDIYSLGVLLYELLSGHTPFDPRELMVAGIDAMRKAIREQEPQRPSTKLATLQGNDLSTTAKRRSTDTSRLLHQVQGDLDWIVMKCLEKDRTRRYETANGLAADIGRHLTNKPVIARPPSTAYKLQKAFRRNKLMFVGGITVFSALAVGITVSLWQANVATRARDRESESNQRLREQVSATEKAKREAQVAAETALQERKRTEQTLEVLQIRNAEQLLSTDEAASGIALLSQVLRANPSNEVAASRLISVLLLPFFQPIGAPLQHDGEVTSAVFSPDGLRILTASLDFTARVWDAGTGKPIGEPLLHEVGVPVYSAQFSPDGLWMVTTSFSSEGRIWDTRTGRPSGQTLRSDDVTYSAEFSPDGQLVLTLATDQTARIWDLRTGHSSGLPLHQWTNTISAAFSPDGLRIVTASLDKTARVWDALTGQPLGEPIQHEELVLSAGFSQDGLRLLTTSSDRTARVWDEHTRQSIGLPLRHDGEVNSAAFSPDGLRIVTASSDKTSRVWDARTGHLIGQPLRHQGPVFSAVFSADGLRVLTLSGEDGHEIAQLWDAYSSRVLSESISMTGRDSAKKPYTSKESFGNSNKRAVSFSPDGLRLVICGTDSAQVWDGRSRQPLVERFKIGAFFLGTERFSPDGLHVMTASIHGGLSEIWEVRTGQPIGRPFRHYQPSLSAEFSRDGRKVVTVSDNTAHVWDASTSRPLGGPLRNKVEIQSAQFSSDGLNLLTVSRNGAVHVFDLSTREPVGEPIQPTNGVGSAVFSPDGLRILTTSYERTAQIWDAQTGKPFGEPLPHNAHITSAKFSPDGMRVVTASEDTTARIWDAQTCKPVAEPLRHKAGVSLAEFSPDGMRLVTVSKDKTARIWDTKTGSPLTDPLQHQAEIFLVQFSPDGSRLMTVSADKTLKVWNALTGQSQIGPLELGGFVQAAQFSPDGQRILTTVFRDNAKDLEVRIWETPPTVVPVPEWFLDWVEARISDPAIRPDHGNGISTTERRRRIEMVNTRADTNFYTRIAQWVEADPSARPISPFSTHTTPEYVRRRIEENTLDSLQEALRVNPTNSLAWARLSLLQTGQDATNHPDRLTQAEFSAHQALRLDSANGDAWRALGTVEFQSGRLTNALSSAVRSVELQPGSREAWELIGDLHASNGRSPEAMDAYHHADITVSGTPFTILKERTAFLERHLSLDRDWTSAGTDAAAAIEFPRRLEEVLSLGRKVEDSDIDESLEVLATLAKSCFSANHPEESSKVLVEYVEMLRRHVAAKPEDTAEGQHLANIHLWMGQTNEHRSLCKEMLTRAAESKDPIAHRRAAKAYLLQAHPEPELLKQAAAAVRQAMKLAGPKHSLRLYFLVPAGIAAIREGVPTEAELLLTEAVMGEDFNPVHRRLALAFRAIARARLGRMDDARADLAELEKEVLPLPAHAPLSPIVLDGDAMAALLAYEEATGLMQELTQKTAP